MPLELAKLANLTVLDLSGNELTGCIPESAADLAVLGQMSCDPRDALVALYKSTGGPNWKNNDNWLSDAPIGEWYGVTTNSKGDIVQLSLGENGLKGEIPPELGYLRSLGRLDLYENELSGQIPPLGELSNLVGLALYSNEMTGRIPPELGRLSKPSTYTSAKTDFRFGQSLLARVECMGKQADRGDTSGVGQAYETGMALISQ